MERNRRNSLIRYIVLIALFAAVMALLYLLFSSAEPEEYSAPPAPVEVVSPEMHTIEEGISVTGYVESETMVPVVPFVSGNIEEYSAAAGMDVRKDDVIAVIDKRPYELQKSAAEAGVRGLEAAYSRAEELCRIGGVSRAELDTLSAQLDAARSQLELADLQLSYTDVKSPVDGTVIEAPLSAGAPATEDTPLAVIADLDDLSVTLPVSEKYFTTVSRYSDAISVRITSADGSLSSEGRVVSISPYIDPRSKTFDLKAALISPDGFVPGMFVRVDIVWKSGEYLSLPLSVRKMDGSVYAVSEDGERAEYIEIESGAEDGNYFSVDPSLEGRSFIIRGQDGLLPGERVAVKGSV